MLLRKILFIEPFYKGSHKYFVDQLIQRSKHNIELASKNGVFWKWKFMESSLHSTLPPGHDYDIIIGSNMLDLSSWAGINRNSIGEAKLVLYFHENQLTYPESGDQKKSGEFFGYMNLTSCFCADTVLFNSCYHKNSFLEAADRLSQKLPDKIPQKFLEELRSKSRTLPVGINTEKLNEFRKVSQNKEPVILWNHRWEFDKNPKLFLDSLIKLKKEGVAFKLIMLGHAPKKLDPFFNEAKIILAERTIQWGSVESYEQYCELLWQADILPVTSNHDFFGISVLEAIYCETKPLLPKRCAYPDHFPVKDFEGYYYEDDSEFLAKLRFELISFSEDKTDNLQELTSVVERYGWDSVLGQFDLLVGEV